MGRIRALLMIGVLCSGGGCIVAPSSSYEGAFSAGQQVTGNAESVPAPIEMTWSGALEVLSRQGFLVQQADENSHTILANRVMRDQQEEHFSYSVTAAVTLIPLGDQNTRVLVAANQTTELHRTQYQWWFLFGLIPIYHVGVNDMTTVVGRDTVRSLQFYQNFFSALNQYVEVKQEPRPSTPSHSTLIPLTPQEQKDVPPRSVPRTAN
jgi:hypothetical protein